MAGEVGKFMFIWVVVIICLTSVSSLLFGELPAYRNFSQVIFTIFSAGLGNYEMSDFESLSFGMVVGEIFIVIVVIINNVVPHCVFFPKLSFWWVQRRNCWVQLQ